MAVFQLALLLCQTGWAAVGFSVTPIAVSNTYGGPITLQATGLMAGDTVVVQKFLDANTNGIVDAGDLLVQQFDLTDGQGGMVIDGVTNINVPGDTDTTAGQITAQLNVQSDFIQAIAGNYLFVLSSPAGHFSPITNLFTVTNFPYAQQITGNVASNGTSTFLPNAIVLLFPPPRPGHSDLGQPLGGAVANNSGSYSVRAPPGTYALFAFASNYLVNTSELPLVALGSGGTILTNLTLTQAMKSISGKLVDATHSSIGIPGVLMSAKATNGLFGLGFTASNGSYTIGVSSGPEPWSIGASGSSVIVQGYVQPQNNTTNVNAGATNIIVGYPKSTALIYGSVKDSLGNPLPGIDVNAPCAKSNCYP